MQKSRVVCMVLRALFVPPYAIQGEDVPAHILWDSIEYSSIKILVPDSMRLKEIYNVNEEMVTSGNQEIVVKKVEMEGYLSLLFSTHTLPENSKNVNLEFSFLDNKDCKIISVIKTLHLFRPELEIMEIPRVMDIDVEKHIVSHRIKIKRLGQGTLILNFNTSPESEVVKKNPDGVIEFLSSVRKDLDQNLKAVSEAFPQNVELINKYSFFLINSWNNNDELDNFKEFISKLTIALQNEKFQEAFARALGEAIFKNIKLLTIPESLLKYLDSVLTNRVWLVQPWQVIPVSKQPKTLSLEITSTDLILNKYDPLLLKDIKIQGKSDGFVELARLFEWK